MGQVQVGLEVSMQIFIIQEVKGGLVSVGVGDWVDDRGNALPLSGREGEDAGKSGDTGREGGGDEEKTGGDGGEKV